MDNQHAANQTVRGLACAFLPLLFWYKEKNIPQQRFSYQGSEALLWLFQGFISTRKWRCHCWCRPDKDNRCSFQHLLWIFWSHESCLVQTHQLTGDFQDKLNWSLPLRSRVPSTTAILLVGEAVALNTWEPYDCWMGGTSVVLGEECYFYRN